MKIHIGPTQWQTQECVTLALFCHDSLSAAAAQLKEMRSTGVFCIHQSNTSCQFNTPSLFPYLKWRLSGVGGLCSFKISTLYPRIRWAAESNAERDLFTLERKRPQTPCACNTQLNCKGIDNSRRT